MTYVCSAFVVMRGPMTSLRSVYNLTDAPYERPTEAPSISVGPLTLSREDRVARGRRRRSVTQVYNLIKDIDDDGNGALDLEEFHLLLHRVGVEFVGKPAH